MDNAIKETNKKLKEIISILNNNKEKYQNKYNEINKIINNKLVMVKEYKEKYYEAKEKIDNLNADIEEFKNEYKKLVDKFKDDELSNILIGANKEISAKINERKLTIQKDTDEMNKLVCSGARYSYLLMLLFALPFFFETETILRLWLKIVPDDTALFVRLGLIGSMFMSLGNTGYTACMATGNIKRYTLWITSIGCLVFPVSYAAYKMGAPVYASYIVFGAVYLVLDLVRLWIMKGLFNFPVLMFIKDVFGRIVPTTLLAVIPPFFLFMFMEQGILRFVANCAVCCISTIASSFLLGMTKQERQSIIGVILKKIKG